MAYYDDVIEKNKRYLTNAQVNALVAASKEYNIQNAGNRAGALASAREQFDTGYRGLQNMGLAGATPTQPTSGEVPRLVQDIRTPFDDYNRRLNDVEHRRLDALVGQFAQQTQAARAAAQQAERARQETLQQQYQRAQAAARAINVKSLPSSPKLNPRDMVQESVKEFPEKKTLPAVDTKSPLAQAGMAVQQTISNAQTIAAASLLGISAPANRAVSNYERAVSPITNKLTWKEHTIDEARGVQESSQAVRSVVDSIRKGSNEADRKALDDAQKQVNYIDSLYKKMAKGEDLTYKEIQAMSQERAAVQRRDLAKEKLENPEKYASRVVLSDPSQRGTAAWVKATRVMAPELADNVLESMGIRKPTMTDEQFTADSQKVKEVRRSLNVIDSLRQEQENKKKTGTTGAIDYDQQFIDEELENLKKLGYTEEKARKLVKGVSNERQIRSEYEYYHKALQTEIENDGLKPSKPVNQSETDTTYRLANNLPSMSLVAKTDYEALATAPAGPAEYMNDKQRNTYNALYETEGINAANKYVEDISPLLNLERARQDKDYREKMVNANWFSGAWQNLLSVGTNLIGNVPAMLEKLAITGYNIVANPDVPKYIDQNSGLSQLSNRTNYIREATSERILKNHNNTWGKVFNFAYQSGMSMADSAAAMGVAWALGSTHAVDALFFSSAGNEAYRDARERGATQDQAMGFAVLSGAAEAIFEHVSVETFADQFIRENAKARRSTIAKLLIQSGTEASEEVTTEIADKLADAWVMGDKSEYDLKVKELMSQDKTLTKEQAEKKAFMDALKDVGMAGLGGLVSGLGFGLTGAIATKKSETKTGKAVKENGKLDRLTRAAKLFGGDVAQQAAEVEAGKQSDAQVGSLLHELQLAQNEVLGIDSESNELITEAQAQEIAKKGEALDVIMEGEQITADDAQKVIDTLGADKLNKMGYDASSADKFAKSYNEALESKSIKPISEVNKAEREFAQGKAVEELREESFERVYKNPKQGLAYQADGKTVTPLPGNLTAVSLAEQERNNFKARTTATTGNVTYAFSGMQAREGMSNEQTLAEMQKALTKEARNKADVYQKLASALGIKMTIHDVMTGTNGFIDESGNMHVVLSGKQSVLRVAAHELTHWMKANNGTGYASLRNHLVNEIGTDRFDRMLAQKAREYGIDTSTEKGRAVADDEVCAELCERMLANEDALEKFAEKDTEAAKSLKDRLLKILNAIKQALKNVKNRDFGESWSDLIREQETIESWVAGLQGAIEKAENKVASEELLLSDEDKKQARRKQETEALTGKGTYVRGYTNAQVEAIIDAGMIGDKSNYEGDDYEKARGMIAQSIPGVMDMMKDYNFTGVHDRINDVATEVVGMYTVAEGDDLANLRKMIPTVIGVDSTAKGDLKAQDQSLFQMSAKLSSTLGRKVTLVSEQNAKGQKNAQYKTAEKLDELWPKIRDAYGLSDEQDFSIDTQKLLEFVESQAGTRKNAREYFGSTLQDEIDAVTTNMEEAMMNLYNEKYGATFSLDTDAIRQAFTVIDTEGIEDGLEALKDVKHVGTFALKDISRMLDASSNIKLSKEEKEQYQKDLKAWQDAKKRGEDPGPRPMTRQMELRNTLHAIFEKPHSEATGRYARGVERMQERVLDIAKRAGVVDAKGKHFDSKKSAAIQNIGEGFSNTYTDLKLKVKDADHVTVKAYEQGTDKLVVSEKDYTLKELRKAYGTNAADYVWSQVFDKTQKTQETGKQTEWVEETVNTRPYTLADLQAAFPNDWQQLKRAADEFRDMYDEYIRDQNNMLATIYPIESEFDSEDRVQKAIDKKQERLEQHKTAVNVQLDNLQKRLEAKEQEMAGKKRTDTKAFRDLVEQANRIGDQIASVKSEIAEYEANVKEELVKLAALKAEYQNARQRGELDSLSRMHRLQYRSDYFHHFTEMASGIQNLRAIFTNNTDQDISPKIVGRSENTKAKSKWANYFQERMGGGYTADAINGMLKYGQLAEYKLAFDPLTAYLRDVNKAIRNLDDNTNRDGLIRYIDQWADAIAGKSHKLDRNISDLGMAPRKAMQILNWINSRVIQNTLLFNARSALIQISNITNAKGIVKNNIDWMNGLRSWALAAKGDQAMADIMAQSNFLASRYMDNLQLTDSKLKSAKAFGGWMLGALDEISAKATWWAAYQQYTRNPNAAAKQYRTYDNAIDYADDVTRRTHAGRGVGELAPAMTSRVINFVAPFQVEVNNTFQLLKDNVKQGNYLGLLSTGLSVFLFNALFEGIVGSSPLQFDFIRAVLDIVLGFAQDDPKDDKDDYGILQAWQRLSGEAFGSLPYAGQLASIIGEDTAKKLFGTDNDATRYGNTQIGVNAVVNAGKGVKDIATGLVEGRKVNWVDDLDDLLNLTLPFGAKQLTRTIEGVRTVAKGYEGKYDKEGKEQVHFATDGDILEAIHAALFGKWSLTEASEYFGEKRLLPQLFGEYNGPKSSIGKAVDAKEYKAALQTGIDGKDYFTLKDDLRKYTTQPDKRAEMMQQQLTPEQKAKLDALMFGSKDAEMKAEGAVVYQKSGDEWKVKADYTNQDLFDLSQAGDKAYTGTLEAMEKTGLPQDQAALAASMWDKAKDADDRKAEFRSMLRDNANLTVEQKEALDLQYCGNKYPADYSDPELYDLSVTNRATYEKAKQAKAKGVPVSTFTGLSEKKATHEGDGQAAYMRGEIMKTNLTAKQKELLDDLLVSDKGSNPDYSSQAWFDVSMLGKTQYETAQEGAKVGLKPEVYLEAYKKYKEIQAKDENGKYINNKRKAKELMKEYLDKLAITAPVYDYIWYNVFKQKKK